MLLFKNRKIRISKLNGMQCEQPVFNGIVFVSTYIAFLLSLRTEKWVVVCLGHGFRCCLDIHVTFNQLLCDTCHVTSCVFMASNHMKHTVSKRISITILLRIKLLSLRNVACGVTAVTSELSTIVIKETVMVFVLVRYFCSELWLTFHGHFTLT